MGLVCSVVWGWCVAWCGAGVQHWRRRIKSASTCIHCAHVWRTWRRVTTTCYTCSLHPSCTASASSGPTLTHYAQPTCIVVLLQETCNRLIDKVSPWAVFAGCVGACTLCRGLQALQGLAGSAGVCRLCWDCRRRHFARGARGGAGLCILGLGCAD